MGDQHYGLGSLPYTAIRIRGGDLANPQIVHFGTGFFYSTKHPHDPKLEAPFIVSNRHVLKDKSWLEFDFASHDGKSKRVFGSPTIVRCEDGEIPIFTHPDPTVDLAAIPLQPLLEKARSTTPNLLAVNLSTTVFPPLSLMSSMHAGTSVMMVGFPNGIMDEVNNLPLVRRGILGTPYGADYRGKKEFVIDIAAFGGSSGSPIFALYEHGMPLADGSLKLLTEPEVYLIGVLHSGPAMSAKGEIVAEPVPTGFSARTQIMIHLGFCLKAELIEELARAAIGVP